MRRHRGTACLLLAVTFITACLPATHSTSAAAVRAAQPVPVGRITDHVIVISIDGLRPDAIERFSAPTLQRLMREGTYSRNAQTILPSTTLPSHTSMLTGVEVDVHGVTFNSDQRAHVGPLKVPTVFSLAYAAGFRTSAFFGKGKLEHLHLPRTLDHVRSLESRIGWSGSAARTVYDVRRHLAIAKPNLLFIHLAETDYAGHLDGWMGHSYARAVGRVDRAVGRLMEEATARFGERQYTVIITADHGGHGRGHGTADPDDTTIPWIVWGEGVRAGSALQPVSTTDTAATVLWLLGVRVPPEWIGRPIAEAFDTSSSAPLP